MKNVFVQRNGYSVYQSGSAVIENTLHRIQDGYIFCSSALNGRSWNTTTESNQCNICFPKQKQTIQLSFFQ